MLSAPWGKMLRAYKNHRLTLHMQEGEVSGEKTAEYMEMGGGAPRMHLTTLSPQDSSFREEMSHLDFTSRYGT